jgi:hypothetical protein
MATACKVGSFTANTVTGNQAVAHGLGSTPKAIIFFSAGPSVTADGNSGHANSMIGMATSSVARCVVSGVSLDVLGTSDTGKDVRTTACIVHLNNATVVPTVDAIADFVSFDATNFTVNWTDAPAAATLIQYMALGGADLTNVSLGSLTPPTSTGTQAITAVNFLPDGVFFLSGSSTATGSHDPISLGFAANQSPIEQGSFSWFDLDAATTMRSWVAAYDNNCIQYALATDAIDAQASLQSFDATGFTLNWTDAATAGGSVFYLALKGAACHVFNRPKPTSNQTETITVGFQPRGLFFSGNGISTINTNSAAAGANAFFSLGASDGTASGTIGNSQNDGNTLSSGKRAFMRTLGLRFITSPTPTNVGDANPGNFTSTGFDLVWTNTNATAYRYSVMAIGDAPTVVQEMTQRVLTAPTLSGDRT